MGIEAEPLQLELEQPQKQEQKFHWERQAGVRGTSAEKRKRGETGNRGLKKKKKTTDHPNTYIMQQTPNRTQSRAPALTTTTVTARQHVYTGSRIPRRSRTQQSQESRTSPQERVEEKEKEKKKLDTDRVHPFRLTHPLIFLAVGR